MFDGKMLRGLTGTPMRRIERANSSLAEAEPEPLTLANLTTKSLTAAMGGLVVMDSSGLLLAACGLRVSHVDVVLAHIPGSGRAAFGAQPAVQADVLVLDH